MEWTRDPFRITTDLDSFDMDFVVRSLQGVWRKGATREKIEGAFAASLCFGLFDGPKQIGYVRVLSDRAFVSWLCDLFLDPAYRGQGWGKWLMDCVMHHPDLSGTRLVLSSVAEARTFYERLGFKPMERGYSLRP